MAKPCVTVALSAIPNTGKTTLFNRLTGENQSTGNWPGVSVERKIGQFSLGEYQVELVDLPGAYALSPVTEEERVVRHYFLDDPPDLVLNILNAQNLYRGLGLTLQMAMSGLPMLVAVNMMDEAKARGLELDLDILSQHLGVPVVGISARSGEGIPELQEALYQIMHHPETAHFPHISCPPVLEEAVKDLVRRLEALEEGQRLRPDFLAFRLLEVPAEAPTEPLKQQADQWRLKIEKSLQTSVPVACASCRFNAARGLVREATHQHPPGSDARSETLDRVLLHRWLGLPLFLIIMALLFQAIYGLGMPLQELLAHGFDAGGAGLRSTLAMTSLPDWLVSLLLDGLWQGVGVVVSFFPLILFFFVFMSLIEDSGYMARAAFLMDRLMHRLGLDGKAFINLLLGYGCNVPAVMGTRILSSRYNRIVTMLLIPFTLCSARLQVFVFMTGILFTSAMAPWVLLVLYLISFVVVIAIGLLLRLFRITGQPEPFIMEIPPYRLPILRSVLLRSWQEMKDFLYRAATLIVAGVLVVWLLTHLPVNQPVAGADTWAGLLGRSVSPLFEPLGIDWHETIALLFGFIAKEIVIGALAVIYGGADLSARIASQVTPLQGLSFMLFVLLYTPCVATVAAIRAESQSWRITFLSLALGLGTAWLASLALYQGGRALGFS